jgi:hypothetical protein
VHAWNFSAIACSLSLQCMVGTPLLQYTLRCKISEDWKLWKAQHISPLSLCLYVLLHWNFNFSPREQYVKLSVSNSDRSICFLKGFGPILFCSCALCIIMKLKRSFIHVHVQRICEYWVSCTYYNWPWIHLFTLMRMRIRLFTLMRIRIRRLTLIRIQIPLFFTCGSWSGSNHRDPNFHVDADSDPDPAPHKSNSNLQSLHSPFRGSIVRVHGPSSLHSETSQLQILALIRIRILLWLQCGSGTCFWLKCVSVSGFSLQCGFGSGLPKWCGSMHTEPDPDMQHWFVVRWYWLITCRSFIR